MDGGPQKRDREEAFLVFREIWDANAQVDPAQVAEDVERAVKEVREVREAKRGLPKQG